MKKTVTYFVSVVTMIATCIALGFLFNVLFPSVKVEYENQSLYRPWEDPLMYLYFLQPFALTAALIWGWNKIKVLFTGSIAQNAFNFSLIYFFVAVIPGMLMTVSSFKVSVLAIVTWTVSAFVQVWVASLIFIRMSK
jgi:hypothetical protein